jgi:hypothetical protein
MPSGPGVSGLAVAIATAGGLLVYAGFRGTTPVQALRDLSTGTAPGLAAGGPVQLQASGALGAAAAGGAVLGGSVAAAAQKYRADKYSQLRRQQTGWSDCSSFCDKILRDLGVPPSPLWSSTANYRSSKDWERIPLADTQPGDVAINSHHMVMITAAGGTAAIGQQNPRVNVRTGTVQNLMSNDFYCLRRRTGRGIAKGGST